MEKCVSTKGRNVIVDLPKGTNVLTATETKSYENMLLENGINGFGNAIYSNGVPQQQININSNGVTKEQMMHIMQSTLGSQASNTTVIDKNGLNTYVKQGHSRKQLLNTRVTFKGRNV